MHWGARQTRDKLETPKHKDEVNKQDIHECDGWAHDPDTMVVPLTPKPTRKVEVLAKVPPTIDSSLEEDTVLKEVVLSRYRFTNDILETKTKDENTGAKDPVPRTNPNTKEVSTTPKPHTHPSHEYDGREKSLFIMNRENEN